MPVTADQPAPYTSPKVVVELIERHRNRGLPTPVNSETLARAGVAEGLVRRTLQSLTGLDLIDGEGKPTQALEAIRLAPQSDYTARLVDWLNTAYADVLRFVDPATADETAVRDAFRNYSPVGQQDRMVTLFLGLFRAAGVAPERPQLSPRAVRNKATITGTTKVPKSATPPPRKPRRDSSAGGAGSDLPPAIAGVLASLPDPSVGWTAEERDRFITAFKAVVDFVIPTHASAQQAPPNGGPNAAA